MRRTSGIALVLIIMAVIAVADERAITPDGRWVILKSDGTWIMEQKRTNLDAPPSPSKWTVSTSTDPMDDTERIVLYIAAEEGGSQYGDKPVLFFRWTDGYPELFVNWDTYISDDGAMVQHRFDDVDPERTIWTTSTSNEATFYGGSVHDFAHRVSQAETLVLRLNIPISGKQVTGVFDVRGLREEIERMPEIKNWYDSPSRSDGVKDTTDDASQKK